MKSSYIRDNISLNPSWVERSFDKMCRDNRDAFYMK